MSSAIDSLEQQRVRHIYNAVHKLPGAEQLVLPFVYTYFNKQEPLGPIEYREHFPMRVHALIEHCYDNGQYLISDGNRSMSEGQKTLDKRFHDLLRKGEAERPAPNEIAFGRDFVLYETERSSAYRVRVVGISKERVNVRLLDYSRYYTTQQRFLYDMPEEFVKHEDDDGDVKNLSAFVGRVTLPPADLLKQWNLPNTEILQPGDRVEMILLTPNEPYLAVAGFAYSHSRRLSPERLVDGFSQEEATNWSAFMGHQPTPKAAEFTIGQLRGKCTHDNRQAIVVAAKGLDKVHVRDIVSATRLAMLQEQLERCYSDGDFTKTLRYTGLEDVIAGMAGVAKHPGLDNFCRVEILAAHNQQSIEVQAVDFPNLSRFFVSLDQLLRPVNTLNFPRQTFVVRQTLHSKTMDGYHLNQLAICLLPHGTLVTLNTASEKYGLVSIKTAGTEKDVLDTLEVDEYDYFDTPYDEGEMRSNGFGQPNVRMPRRPDVITDHQLIEDKFTVDSPRLQPRAPRQSRDDDSYAEDFSACLNVPTYEPPQGETLHEEEEHADTESNPSGTRPERVKNSRK